MANIKGNRSLNYDDYVTALAKKQKVLTSTDTIALADETVGGVDIVSVEAASSAATSAIAALQTRATTDEATLALHTTSMATLTTAVAAVTGVTYYNLVEESTSRRVFSQH
jgi:hypothetical protein